MIVANAANETRAPLGVGFFAYPDDACTLSTRTLSSVSPILFFLSGRSKQANVLDNLCSLFANQTVYGSEVSPQLLQRSAAVSISLDPFSSGDSDSVSPAAMCLEEGESYSFSHYPSSPVLCVGGGMSTLLSALSLLPSDFSSPTAFFSVAARTGTLLQGSASAPVFRDDANYISASAEGLLSRAACLTEFSVPGKLSSWVSGATLSCGGEVCAAGWHFLPNSAAAFTISAPWFHAHARYGSFFTYHPLCRGEARRCFRGGLALQVGRALRL